MPTLPIRLLALLPALLCAALTLPARAVVGGAGPDPAATASPWAGVGAVVVGGKHYSGALVSPRHVLTAAHVVKGASPEQVAFRIDTGSPGGLAVPARAIFVHPGFHGAQRGADGVWHDDIAIVELAGPAPFLVPVYELYDEFILLKSMVAFAGYGGDGKDGSRHVRRIGYNRIDTFIPDDHGSGRPEVFLFDYDGPDYRSNVFKPDSPVNAGLGPELEATFASGDSGAPVFVLDKGRWKIVGVAAFVAGAGGKQGGYGSVGGGMLVPAYLDWLRGILTPAP